MTGTTILTMKSKLPSFGEVPLFRVTTWSNGVESPIPEPGRGLLPVLEVEDGDDVLVEVRLAELVSVEVLCGSAFDDEVDEDVVELDELLDVTLAVLEADEAELDVVAFAFVAVPVARTAGDVA